MKKQQGLSLVGLMFVGFLVVGGAVLLMKIVPPYLEFWSVKKIIDTMARDSATSSMSPDQVKRSFDKRASIDYVTVIRGSDLEVSKERGQNVVTAHYTVTVPLVGNLSALMEFEASTSGASSGKKLIE